MTTVKLLVLMMVAVMRCLSVSVYAGHFLLTHLLLNKLKAAPSGGRIVSVTANAYRLGEIVLDDLQFERRECKPGEAYAQSKLAVLLFTRKLSRHLQSMSSVCCFCSVSC